MHKFHKVVVVHYFGKQFADMLQVKNVSDNGTRSHGRESWWPSPQPSIVWNHGDTVAFPQALSCILSSVCQQNGRIICHTITAEEVVLLAQRYWPYGVFHSVIRTFGLLGRTRAEPHCHGMEYFPVQQGRQSSGGQCRLLLPHRVVRGRAVKFSRLAYGCPGQTQGRHGGRIESLSFVIPLQKIKGRTSAFIFFLRTA